VEFGRKVFREEEELMKEITRRLYRKRKPVMIGMTLLVGIVLLVGLFVTAKSRAATTYIPAGDDRFETTDNGETYHNFAGSPIPAGFFNTNGGSTSQPYSGLVPLEGLPLPGQDDIDTIIRRNQAVYTPGTTSLRIVALSLVSINPITVTYTDRPPEDWSVGVGLSDHHASTGSMTIGAGGTFDSTLKVYPKFTFTRLSDGAVKVLDTGGSAPSPLSQSSADDGDGIQIEPHPAPVPKPFPCPIVVDIEGVGAQPRAAGGSAVSTSAAGNCPPVTLTSNNSPWAICAGGGFCIPRPITEWELLASHFASPPGTKRRGIR
jgi:hypothetical protein